MSSPTIILVTGGNTGLGLEIVKSLCRSAQPYTILIGSRDLSKAEAAISNVKSEYPSTGSTLSAVQVDLSSDESIEAAVAHITSTHGRLDVLLNNGGAAFDNEAVAGRLSVREMWNKTWDTNVAGTQVLTTGCIPLLLKSSNPRLLFMTSGTATLTETERNDIEMLKRINSSPPAGWPKPAAPNTVTAYRSAKTGLNMLMREWTRILGNDGVKVWCISPGFLATGLGGVGPEMLKKMGALDPAIGADHTVSVIEGKRDHEMGKILRKDMIQPW